MIQLVYYITGSCIPLKIGFDTLIIYKYDVQFSHDLMCIEWCNTVIARNSKFDSNTEIYLKISLVGTPFPLNFLCGNAVPMRSRPTTPLLLWFAAVTPMPCMLLCYLLDCIVECYYLAKSW